MRLTKTLKVKNDLGLHIRPAAKIVKLFQNTKCEVSFSYKKETINAKSIMSILMLAAKKNAKILVTIEGANAKELMEKLTKKFEKRFGEENANN
ncbi:MAG: Phosphocarrier protein HPr [Candidatus Anoxychlamydiales bacterium]|uniref:HPr domain-containing protein n=1 Tax=marine sediment metagenome TaxID=412755 RepID=A0A0F9IZT5_9ZZZZ|nr:Phosphocarrier protein HPr [Candidatus Anoxychlamydiales bacterium]HEU64289.1 HPr family phosphocarrier protein [Chlamydiota bacterium]